MNVISRELSAPLRVAAPLPPCYAHGVQLKVFAFAQAAEVAGFRERVAECSASETARAVIARVAPALDLRSTRIAIDGEYRDADEPIGNAREIALLPPVSGG